MRDNFKPPIDLKRLTYFLAVAEELNFSRASERLKMAQPPLSRQIAQLEIQLGAELFDRSRSQIRLTQAGELLLERTHSILELVEQTAEEVKQIGEGGAGRLRIAFVGTATFGLLPKILRAYRATNPNVVLALSAMNNAELKSALIQKKIDIAIARPKLDDPELKTEPVVQEKLLLAVPDTYKRTHLRLSDFQKETFVLYPRYPRPSFADFVIDVCKNEGFTPQDPILAQDYQTAISLVSIGVGVSLVPESVAESQRIGVNFCYYDGYNPGTALSINYRRDSCGPHITKFLEASRRIIKISEGAIKK